MDGSKQRTRGIHTLWNVLSLSSSSPTTRVQMEELSKPVIFYRGKTQYENLGDLLIARTLLAVLREHGRVIFDDTRVPSWYRKEIGVQDSEGSSTSALPFFIQLFLHGACGRLSRRSIIYLMLPPTHSYSKSLQRDMQLVLALPLIVLLRLLGVRICRLGGSIGPFTLLRGVIEVLGARQMYYYSLRESSSMAYAHRIGVQRIECFPEITLLMPVPALSAVLPVRIRNEAVLSFRQEVRSGCKAEGYVACLLPILDEIVDCVIKSASFKVQIAYQVEEDQPFSLFLYERYRNRYDFVFPPKHITQKTMGEVYSSAALAFSNRLHVLLLGALHGCIPVAVIDADEQQKISGVFNDMYLNRLIIDVRHDTFKGEWILNSLQHYAIIQERISNYTLLRRREARCALQRLFEKSG